MSGSTPRRRAASRLRRGGGHTRCRPSSARPRRRDEPVLADRSFQTRTPPSPSANDSPSGSAMATASAGTSITTTSGTGSSAGSPRATAPFRRGVLPRSTGRLQARGRGLVADVGCGHGASTILMGGFPPALHRDRLPRRVDRPHGSGPRRRASQRDVRGRGSGDYAGEAYDLVAFFDAFHDLGDPRRRAPRAKVLARRDVHARRAHAGDGSDNLTQSAGSTTGTRRSSARPVAVAARPRGARHPAGEARLREVLQDGGSARSAARRDPRTSSSRLDAERCSEGRPRVSLVASVDLPGLCHESRHSALLAQAARTWSATVSQGGRRPRQEIPRPRK